MRIWNSARGDTVLLCGKPALAAYPGMADEYYLVCEDFATERYIISIVDGDHQSTAALIKSRIQAFTFAVRVTLYFLLHFLTLGCYTAAFRLCDFGG